MNIKATNLELLILEHLPAEPNGLSVHELADGLLGNAGPQGRSVISGALKEIAMAIGGLACRRGDDYLGHFDVDLWGLPWDTWCVLRRAWPMVSWTDPRICLHADLSSISHGPIGNPPP